MPALSGPAYLQPGMPAQRCRAAGKRTEEKYAGTDMQVDQILKVTDKKKKVILEDGRSFVLYSGEVRKFRIREGEELPEDVICSEIVPVLRKRARLRCMNLLKSSDRTVMQLRDKLKRDGHTEEIIEDALAYVASYHYTDDRRYAENYIRSCRGRKSTRMISFDLQKKGVGDEDIRAAFDAVAGEDQGTDPDQSGDMEAIRRLLKKRGYDPEQATFEEKQKQIRYLMGRGFSMTDIRRCLSDHNLTAE